VIVLDASVLVNALGDDGASGDAARRVVANDATVALPDLADVETAAVLRKRWLAGSITAERYEAAVEDLVDLPSVRHPSRQLVGRAFELRDNVSTYDAVYVALAEALQCPLATADRRLARAVGPTCEFVIVTV
jgi:predicted nucleic acid-binding protein